MAIHKGKNVRTRQSIGLIQHESSGVLLLQVFPKALTFILPDFNSYKSIKIKEKERSMATFLRVVCMPVFLQPVTGLRDVSIILCHK